MTDLSVVAQGPGPAELLTLGELEAMRAAPALVLRTGVHPVADYLRKQGIAFTTLDDLHESSEDFDALAQRAVNHLINLAQQGPVVYAVPDPAQDATVQALRAACEDIAIQPGVPLAAAGPCARAGARRTGVTATGLAVHDAQHALVITELNSRELAGDVKLKAAGLYDVDTPSYSTRRAGGYACVRAHAAGGSGPAACL